MKYSFPIDPVPASRPRVPRFGKAYYLPTYENFRQTMATLLLKLKKARLIGELQSDITFWKLIPKSFSNRKRVEMHGTYCVSNFDLDNCEKAIYDALNGHAYVDDSQIVEHTTRKKWTMDDARIDIEITSI